MHELLIVAARVGQLWKTTMVGHNCIYTPYMTVYLVISLPKISYINRIYMVLAYPKDNRLIFSACVKVLLSRCW